MRPIRADFVVSRPLLPWFAGVVLIAGAAVGAAQIIAGLEFRRRAAAAAEQEAHLLGALARTSVPAPRLQQAAPPYAQDAAALAATAGYDFGKVLSALETVRVPGIKVSSVDIVPTEALARIELEVADGTALLDYVGQLNAGLPDSGGRWRILRVQAPAAGALGAATLLAPNDIDQENRAGK